MRQQATSVRDPRARGRIAALILLASIAVLAGVPRPAQAGGDPTYRPPFFLKRDTAAPILKVQAPQAGSITRNRTTEIKIEATDPLILFRDTSRLYLPSLSFTVNGVDQTSNVVVVAEGIWRWLPWLRATPVRARFVYTPTAAAPLPEGPVSFTLAISDRAGNRSQITSQFRTDTTPPTIDAISPSSGSVITGVTTPLTFRVADAVAGVRAASLAVTFVGEAGAGTPTLSGETLTIAPPAGGWQQGALGVRIEIDDTVGNHAIAEFAYSLTSGVDLAAYPRAVPASGDAPLRVVFAPDVITTTAIERYEWDLDGNGTFDRTETVGTNQQFTYTIPGQYTVTLRITDSLGRQATGTVVVTVGNRPPEVSAEASPSNGAPPLAVTFSAAATDSNGIAQYQWDFDGNGSYDSSSASNVASFTYAAAGTFRPRLRVTDTLGAATELTVPSIEVRVVEGAPTVTASVSPGTGNAPLNASFNATVNDPGGATVTEWAWDFNGDGAFDTTSATSAAATFRYTTPGTYYARVRATMSDGGIGIDVVRVVVNLTLSLSLSTDTLDSSLSESVNVNTTLGGDTNVSLVMENTAGAIVRTLVPFTARAAGTYSDAWDGRDDQGGIVSEDQYRAILLYRFDSETRRFDLGLTTGAVQSNPPRSGIPSRFAPLAGNPLVITYTLSRASEVTAFMGRFNVNTRLITFHQREAKGRGAHAVVWNGENTDGQLIHPPAGDSFLFGIFAFTLPDNAIFVKSGVDVSAVSSTPSVYDPTDEAEDGAPALSHINFTLNRPGRAELSAYDAATGTLIVRRTISGLNAGPQSITWDGRNAEGVLVAPGRYRLGICGVDEAGARSTTVYTLQRVYY